MLVSAASFVPIIIVGPISDIIGTAAVIFIVAILVLVVGVASVFLRDPSIGPAGASADPHAEDPIAAALGADRPTWRNEGGAPASPLVHPPVGGHDLATEVTTAIGPADPADRD